MNMTRHIKNIFSYLYKQLLCSCNPEAKFLSETSNERQAGKVICLFVHYDSQNNISKSDLNYVKELNNFADVIFISNSIAVSELPNELHEITLLCVFRKNVGYDFGAWKDVILQYREMICRYDCLILVNNSVYCPIIHLMPIVNKMNERDNDFWGMTAFTERRNGRSREAHVLGYFKVPQHIQSYFLVFKKKVLEEEGFYKFWKDLEYPETFIDAVRYGEIALSQTMINLGYKSDVYIRQTLNNRRFRVDGPDMSKYEPDKLLCYGMPLIKKKALNLITVKQYLYLIKTIEKYNDELADIIARDYCKAQFSWAYRMLNRIFGGRLNRWRE